MAELKLLGEVRQKIANQVKDIIKSVAGKGPSDLKIKTDENNILIYCTGFLTHLERNLLNAKVGERLIVDIRKAISDLIRDEVTQCVSACTGLAVKKIDEDYDPQGDAYTMKVQFEEESMHEDQAAG